MTPTPLRLADAWLPTLELARRGFEATPPLDAAELGRTLMASLDATVARAREHGYSSEQVQSALFAVVAWIDEAAMTQPWPGASVWRLSPLQRHYFATTRAGVEFFQRLEQLGEEDTAVREVYGLMLIAGFTGHYSGKPAGELAAWRRDLLERIQFDGKMRGAVAGQTLFPAANPPRTATGSPTRSNWPVLSIVLLILIPLGLLVGLYAYLDTSLAALAAPLMIGS